MPNRIIKESICTSDTINQLSWFEEVCLYRLIVSCDDYGRMDARPAILKATMFPLDESVTTKSIMSAIDKMASIGLVVRYESNGKPHVYLPSWCEHQRVRDSKEKYPAPQFAASCGELRRVAASCGELPQVAARARAESESESESNTPPTPPRGFDVFWEAYPRKVGKDSARKAFEKRKPDAALLSEMLTAIEQQRKSSAWKKESGQFIPHPATWLNQGRWQDEVEQQDNYYKRLN